MFNIQPLRSKCYAEDLAAMAHITPDSFPVRKKHPSPTRSPEVVRTEIKSEGFRRNAEVFYGTDDPGNAAGRGVEAGKNQEYARAREQFYAVTPQSTGKPSKSHNGPESTAYAQARANFYAVTPQSTASPTRPAAETPGYTNAREQFYAVTPAKDAQKATSASFNKAQKQFFGDS